MALTNYKESVRSLTNRLVNTQSYSGKENNVADELIAFAKPLFDEVTTDDYGNVLMTMNGDQDGKTILLDGHLDTVEVDRNNWDTDPFKTVEKNNRLYGRGTSDMKGADSSAIHGVLKYVDSVHHHFPGKIIVSATVHEETLEGVSSRLITKEASPDFVIICEATGLKLNQGQRGRAEVIVETFGKRAHSANPEKGINALMSMSRFLNQLEQMPTNSHPVLGKGISVVTDIISSPYPGMSITPDHCKITIDRRTLVNETEESVLEPYQKLLDSLTQQYSDFKGKVSYSMGVQKCYTGTEIKSKRFFPAWFYDEKEPFIQAGLRGLKSVGLTPELSHYSFCTNGSHFAGELKIPTIGFGPSFENLAHIDNEYIDLNQLYSAIDGYKGILTELVKTLND